MTASRSWAGLRLHPAWLLLFLAPLLSLVQAGLVDYSRGFSVLGPEIFLQVLLGLGVLGWLFVLERPGRPPGAVWLAKELRGQLPGFLLAAGGPALIGAFVEGEAASFMYAPYFVGCCLLGASSMAAEFEQRTMSTLLVQPVGRARLYRLKLGVLGLLLTLAAAEAWLSGVAFENRLVPRFGAQPGFGEMFETFGVAPLLAFLTGPALGLLTRSTPAAAVLIVGGPLSIAGGVSALLFTLGLPRKNGQ